MHNKPEIKTDIQFDPEIIATILAGIDADIWDNEEHSKGWIDNISKYIRDHINNQPPLTSFKKVSQLVYFNKGQYLPKDAIKLCKLFHADPALLLHYYNSLTRPEQEFLYKLTWNDHILYLDARAHFNQELIKPVLNIYHRLQIAPAFKKWAPFLKEGLEEEEYYDADFFDDYDEDDYEFGLFGKREDTEKKEGQPKDPDLIIRQRAIYFKLPDFMRRAFAQITHKPANYHLSPMSLQEGHKIFLSEAAIFEELPAILLLLRQGKIKYNQNGYLSTSTLKTAQIKLCLQAFPNDNGHLKSLMIASHLLLHSGYDPTTAVPEILRFIFEIQQPNIYTFHAALFPFGQLKSIYKISQHPLQMNVVFGLLKLLPVGQWFGLPQLIDYVEHHNMDLKIAPIDGYAVGELVLSASYDPDGVFADANIKTKLKIIQELFIAGTLQTAASLGLLDLAYDQSASRKTLPGSAIDYPEGTIFTACRLTPLGEHLFQGKRDYKAPDAAKPISFELAGDRHHLIIKVDGNIEIAAGLLKAWTKRSTLNTNELMFDWITILEGCTSKEELTKSIQAFCDMISLELPPFWKAQFMEMIHQTHAVQPLVQAKVFKLSPFDTKLHQLIAKDPLLKQLSLKAEDFTLVVPLPNEAAFLKRLAGLGYIPFNSGHIDSDQISFIATGQAEQDLIDDFNSLQEKAKANANAKADAKSKLAATAKNKKNKNANDLSIFRRRYL